MGADRPSDPAHRSGRAPFHETDPSLLDAAATPGDAAETGTTVVGLTAGDGVVPAADRRASVGGRVVTSKRVRKVEAINPTAALALSGAIGRIQEFVWTLRAESRLYEQRRGEPMSLTALSTLAGGVLRRAPSQVAPLLGGVDEDGPRVFELDGDAGVLSEAYAAGGSGMQGAGGGRGSPRSQGLGGERASSTR